MKKMDRFKPAVPRRFLLALAGLAWLGVGVLLLVLAGFWLTGGQRAVSLVCVGSGVAAAVLIHHLGFSRIAAKNIARILSLAGSRCVFSFFTWRNYFLIIVMVTMGRLLRHSTLPRQYLAILYIAIGLALVLSSLRYFRVFIDELKGAGSQGRVSTEDRRPEDEAGPDEPI